MQGVFLVAMGDHSQSIRSYYSRKIQKIRIKAFDYSNQEERPGKACLATSCNGLRSPKSSPRARVVDYLTLSS